MVIEVTGMKIKKDDLVQIISGKDKGKKGKVLKVINKYSKVIVEMSMLLRNIRSLTSR